MYRRFSPLLILIRSGWPTEDRHFSFAIGGDAKALSLASLIGRHSKELVGSALIRTPPNTPPTAVPFRQLNLAQLSIPMQ
jgi:hypothetical protein